MSKIMKWGAVAIIGLLMIQSASALCIVRERSDYEYYVTGTEFMGDYAVAATYMGGFDTFCIERNEVVYLGQSYQYTTESYAIAGGNAGQVPGVGGDPLSQGTAWLYSRFATGALGNFAYGAGRSTSAYYLQEAFWWLEQEITSYSSINPFLTSSAFLAEFTTAANARLSATPGQYDVYALNLTRPSDGALRQSLLVYDVRQGPGPTPVADGGLTVIMLGAGVMACSFLRRKIAA